MKKVWKVIGTSLAKLALWAANHPDEIAAVVAAAKAAKK